MTRSRNSYTLCTIHGCTDIVAYEDSVRLHDLPSKKLICDATAGMHAAIAVLDDSLKVAMMNALGRIRQLGMGKLSQVSREFGEVEPFIADLFW